MGDSKCCGEGPTGDCAIEGAAWFWKFEGFGGCWENALEAGSRNRGSISLKDDISNRNCLMVGMSVGRRPLCQQGPVLWCCQGLIDSHSVS